MKSTKSKFKPGDIVRYKIISHHETYGFAIILEIFNIDKYGQPTTSSGPYHSVFFFKRWRKSCMSENEAEILKLKEILLTNE